MYYSISYIYIFIFHQSLKGLLLWMWSRVFETTWPTQYRRTYLPTTLHTSSLLSAFWLANQNGLPRILVSIVANKRKQVQSWVSIVIIINIYHSRIWKLNCLQVDGWSNHRIFEVWSQCLCGKNYVQAIKDNR